MMPMSDGGNGGGVDPGLSNSSGSDGGFGANPSPTTASTGNTGASGSSFGRMSLGQTPGYGTHDRTEPNDDDEESNVPGLFNDRRSEGRRLSPTAGGVTHRDGAAGLGVVKLTEGYKRHSIKGAMDLPPQPGRRVTPHQRHLN